LKRWRYVAVFCEELMACAALVQIGPARQSFWAVLPRGEDRMRERTRMFLHRDAVELTPGRLRTHAGDEPKLGGPAPHAGDEPVPEPGRFRIDDAGVLLDLRLDEDAGIEARCPHGRAHVWTRKQAGLPARGTLALDGGPPRQIEARAVIDDTAGHHARFTEWWWSAGVGAALDGSPLAWNLVEGINDPLTGSERAVWIAGEPAEAPPVSFARDLSAIRAADGSSELRFLPEAERRRRENLLIVRSDYRAPFGVFSGTLPGGAELARGLGVMEHHRAWW
jgi:hypothetical protein